MQANLSLVVEELVEGAVNAARTGLDLNVSSRRKSDFHVHPRNKNIPPHRHSNWKR